ncbi:hypothetical protein B0H12DRAFT_189961 [Mycena haematopus]|nr:hypothetical protein B0H12DRAFT_189961 [Mycena haematopus]
MSNDPKEAGCSHFDAAHHPHLHPLCARVHKLTGAFSWRRAPTLTLPSPYPRAHSADSTSASIHNQHQMKQLSQFQSTLFPGARKEIQLFNKKSRSRYTPAFPQTSPEFQFFAGPAQSRHNRLHQGPSARGSPTLRGAPLTCLSQPPSAGRSRASATLLLPSPPRDPPDRRR